MVFLIGMNGLPPWMVHYSNRQPSPRQRLLSRDSYGGGESDEEDQYRQYRENGDYLSAGNGKLTPSASVVDMNDPEQRSIIHYELGYEKTHMSCLRGTLTFALRYDFIHRVLMVHVIRAQHLPVKVRG